VAVDGSPPAQHFQLIVADADGANQHLVLESRFPLMSPSWSPDGQWLAYVSFETKHSGVYVQLVRSGERRQVSRVPVSTAPPSGHRTAASWRSPWAAAAAIPTSTSSISPPRT